MLIKIKNSPIFKIKNNKLFIVNLKTSLNWQILLILKVKYNFLKLISIMERNDKTIKYKK